MAPAPDVSEDVRALERDGIVARSGAFTPEWVAAVREDVEVAFADAVARGAAVGRGPERWYVEIHPEQLRGFVELVTHPWVAAMCEAVLGPDHVIVELGFDIPFPGAADQPWHRDFPASPSGGIDSLAFNLTCVDTVPAMGPMEIALGTHREAGEGFRDGMFPPPEESARYASIAVPKLPQVGDVSARSALTIHRGTANRSDQARPVLVLGVDAPGAGHEAMHDLAVTRRYWEQLPDEVRRHLPDRVVDQLTPIVQKHQIAGLETYG